MVFEPSNPWHWLAVVYLGVVTPVSLWYFVVRRIPLRKPDGYVGVFERPDRSVVHVARVNGRLMIVSREQPGTLPKDLGTVSGRDLSRWRKLASDPNHGVARAD